MNDEHSPAHRAARLNRYAAGADAVEAALDGITDAELDARPGPDSWSAREIVHHLADSEMTSAIRLRKLVAEDDAVIHGYDEGLFARRLHYGERPIDASLQAMRASRLSSADLLGHLTVDEWHRAGTHTESGRYSVETWLQVYGDHPHDHARQIRDARSSAVRGDSGN